MGVVDKVHEAVEDLHPITAAVPSPVVSHAMQNAVNKSCNYAVKRGITSDQKLEDELLKQASLGCAESIEVIHSALILVAWVRSSGLAQMQATPHLN